MMDSRLAFERREEDVSTKNQPPTYVILFLSSMRLSLRLRKEETSFAKSQPVYPSAHFLRSYSEIPRMGSAERWIWRQRHHFP